MMHRLERRLEAAEQHVSSNRLPRPDPDLPYGMPLDCQSPSWTPAGISTSSVAVTIPPWPPHMPAASHTSTYTEGPRPSAIHGANQRLTALPSTTSWDPPVSRHAAQDHHGQRSSWDSPSTRAPPSSYAHDPSKLIRMDPSMFDGSNAQSWVTRI